MIPNLGHRNYLGAMALSAAMVGNSSSGLVEAPSFHLPVVNIGPRQKGRTRGDNVIDAAPTRDAIARALAEALSPAFRSRIAHEPNPYQGSGRAADRILETLRTLDWHRLIPKRFCDLEGRS
jgi:UDP-N-acetylglucosamine 2-epimerase